MLFCTCSLSAKVYHTGDSLKVAAFLNKISADGIHTNGYQLNPDYDATNPDTWLVEFGTDNWKGFKWTSPEDTAEASQLLQVVVDGVGLAGALDLSNCDSLYGLWCDYNQLTTINVLNCHNLFHIECGYNQLTTINVQNCPDLKVLNVPNNLLTTINLTGTTNLKTLTCNSNYISNLDLENSTMLSLLIAYSNNLTPGGVRMPKESNVDAEYLWIYLGKQRPFVPKEVLPLGSGEYISKGLVIDLSNYAIDTLTPNFVWYNELSIPTFNYTQDANVTGKYIFNSIMPSVYCNIKYPTFYNLELESVHFSLSFPYNNNDVEKIRAFLNKPSVIDSVTNGIAVNENYDATDPRTFAVRWEPKPSYAPTEYRVTYISDWQNKAVAGSLDLTGTTYLNTLIIKNNEITSIALSDNTAITELDVQNNLLTELNATKHPHLLYLYCNDNNITALDLTLNSKLILLNCSNNNLTQIGLNVTGLTDLEEIYCDNNTISYIDVRTLTNIRRISCNNNIIEKFTTTGLTKINWLSADNNRIDSIDLSASKDLQHLAIKNNALRYLSLASLNTVEYFHCDSNKLDFNSLIMPKNLPANTSLSPQDTIAREYFNLINGNYFSKTDIIDLSNYISAYDTTYFTWKTVAGDILEVNTTGIYKVIDNMDGLSIYCEVSTQSVYPELKLYTPIFIAEFAYNDNDVAKLRAFLNQYSKFGNAENGGTNGKELTPDYVSEDPSTFPVNWTIANGEKRLSYVDWAYQNTLKGNLDLSDCQYLTHLYTSCEDNISRNDITSLNLANCTRIKNVWAEYNQITNLNITDCESITDLDVAYNVISNEINIPSKNMDRINLSNNKIPAIKKLDSLTQLTSIDVSNNKLMSIHLEGDTSIQIINCANNELINLNLSMCGKVKKIDASNNKLTNINLNTNPRMQVLNIANNELTSINVSKCPELASLNCSNNKLTELDLSPTKYLTALTANNNMLTFANVEFDKLPNEFAMHPQATITLTGIVDDSNVLIGDKLDLSAILERPDSTTHYVFRYLDGSVVSPELYNTLDKGVFSFSDELKNRTIYVEATNGKFPDVTLSTIKFNTVPPDRYNENDVVRMRYILDQQSKTIGISNGAYLTSVLNKPNYNANEPATFPGAIWNSIDNEYRLVAVKWNGMFNLNGTANFNGCDYLDTLLIIGTFNTHTGINKVTLDVKDIKYINVSYSNLTELTISNMPKLDYLNVSYNALTFATFNLDEKPNTLLWEQQADVVPAALTQDGDGWKITQNLIDLTKYGTGIDYVWTDINTGYEQDMFNDNGLFMITASCDLHTIKCTMTATNGVLEGLTLSTVPFYVDLHNSIFDAEAITLAVSPNPVSTNAVVTIGADGRNLQCTLFNATGSKIATVYEGAYSNEVQLNTNNLSTGAYYLQVTVDDKTNIIPINISK
jgi:Leucine-rich repeat (LRR) protein